MAAPAICATTGVVRCAFGSIDLATQLGVDPADKQALLFARSALVMASAAALIAPPVDGVTTALRDRDVLMADLAHAKRLGMTAKLCVHPSQIAAVHAAAAPAAADILWARGALDAADVDGSAVDVGGQLVDTPVIARARGIVAAGERLTAR
jgi:citrate lyase subunit beta / citryl-CoA lyase